MLRINSDVKMQSFNRTADIYQKRYGLDRQEALERIAKRYKLNVEYDNSNRSILDRMLGRNKHINEDSLIKQWGSTIDKEVDKMVEAGVKTSEIGKWTRRRGPLGEDRLNKIIERQGSPAAGKGTGKGFGWKGKAGAGVALLALGGVIGSMFAGGHKSNAELYNPNPQPQYYS